MAKGRSVNLLAPPKDPNLLRIFTAPNGMVLGQFDLSSIEPRTLAHYSNDPKMLAICGLGGIDYHDVYLVGGMSVPGIGEKIKEAYNFETATREEVAAAKKLFAKERKDPLKPGYLGWMYGLGAETFSTKSGLTVAEARNVLRGFDRAFPGKKALQQQLEREWVKRGGWILNGRGLPMAIDFGAKKDCVSRFVQGTAHTVLLRILFHLNSERTRLKIPKHEMYPYVPDFHDESIWAMLPEHTEVFKETVEYAFSKVNEEFAWQVKIQHGGLSFGTDLSIRCED